tara:strand:+ start:59 stop:688 length:630 start_codon:yes stop_codon:yes gene_type:complete
MSTFKRKKSSFLAKLRNYFITGIVVLIPIGLTLYLTKFIIEFSSRLLPNEVNPNNYLPFKIPGLEIIVAIIFITIIGGLSLSFIGKKILQIFNDLLKRIPILRTIYSAIGQLTETFAPQQSAQKKSVVLIEYPRKGTWAVGFATKDNEGEISKKTNSELVNVFVPTTPNPTSGFLLMFPKSEIKYLDMTFEEASRFIVSAGTSENKNKN